MPFWHFFHKKNKKKAEMAFSNKNNMKNAISALFFIKQIRKMLFQHFSIN
jgi:hypothetical protein